MELRLERNGRIWKGNLKEGEEVLDIFYGDKLKDKLGRGMCSWAYDRLIKEPLEIGEAIIINLEILSKEKKNG